MGTITNKIRKTTTMLVVVGSVSMATTAFAADYDTHWAKNTIAKWSNNQVVKGYGEGIFKPNNNVTRAEFAAFITRIFNLTDTTSARTYSDVQDGNWYTDAVNKVSNLGIMYTPGDKFEPNKAITREEAAYAMANAYQLYPVDKKTEIKDSKEIANWAMDSVIALAQRGYMNGNTDGTFNPKGNLTRAEAVTLFENVSPNYINTTGTYSQNMKGNVVINTGDVILKNITIDGNIYIAEGIQTDKVTLDNVTVKGKVYIEGSQATLSGTFETIEIASGKPVALKKGTAKEIIIEKPGTVLTLQEGTVTDKLTLCDKVEILGEGTIKGSSDGKATTAITRAELNIAGKCVALPMENNVITINVPELMKAHPGQDQMESLAIYTQEKGYILGFTDSTMYTNTVYDFYDATKATGILDEMVEEILSQAPNLRPLFESVGVNGDTVFSLMGNNTYVSMRQLVGKYNYAKNMVLGYSGVTMKDEYSFRRTLYLPNQKPIEISIKLIVQ
ncbi:MAG: S-layer homology domain-containing protein [Cellulosilyticaceae bacterium]